jgi:hypothetical protein
VQKWNALGVHPSIQSGKSRFRQKHGGKAWRTRPSPACISSISTEQLVPQQYTSLPYPKIKFNNLIATQSHPFIKNTGLLIKIYYIDTNHTFIDKE